MEIGALTGKIYVEGALTIDVSNCVTQDVTPLKMPNLVTISQIYRHKF